MTEITQSADRYRRPVYTVLLVVLLLLPAALLGYKLFVLDYDLARLLPALSYQVELGMKVDGHGDDIRISTYLPASDSRQRVYDETNSSGAFAMQLVPGPENRVAVWRAEKVSGENTILYRFSVQADHVRYNIPPGMKIPRVEAASMGRYLAPAPGIQSDDPLIDEALKKLVPDRDAPLLEILTAIHRHLQDDFRNMKFSGFTDALTALKLGEASCNGKSRLFAAMLRRLGVPARLAGGLIMRGGSKRTTHQWVEAYINGHWVPFDTINDHFAELPANYLTLYYGDLVLFRHTTNVNFNYFFKMTRRLVPRISTREALSASVLSTFNVYSIFEQVGISQNLLKIMLMIPLGALVVVIFRNVVGVETFGTFLPALIAAAARETGLLWGLAGFVLIIGVSSLVRKGLDWLRLLHSPKMAIMLTAVVIFMLAITIFGVRSGLLDLAHVTLFPIAILAITAERFAIMEVEEGLARALRVTCATLLVIAACYVVMDSLFLQSMFLAFPELLLVVVAMNMWIGRWIGIRLVEFIRFRSLIFGGRP